MAKSQDKDLVGEVIAYITPVLSMHFNRSCEVECSNYGQSELARLAIDAYDYQSVHGAKPKVWVQITRTQRVKKYLANEKKRAAKGTPDEVTTDADDNPMLVEDGGDVNVVPMSADKVTTKTAPKKTTNRVDEGVAESASGSGEESLDQCILSGKAGKKISPTLPLTTCITNTRPEYLLV